MRRADKLALLTRILSGQAAGQTRKQLSPSLGRGGIVIIYQPGDNTNPGPDDVVSFYHKGEQVSIPFKDIKAFTRYDPLTITWMPDNHRRKRDKSV